MHGLKGALALVVAGSLLTTPAWADRQFRGGVVAAAHPLASQAAVDVLEHGGNAVDAAVAAAFVMGVVGPYHSGLGGGGFALVYDAKTGTSRFLDFREVAPAAATRDMYLRNGQFDPKLSTEGGLAVAIPGAPMGYLELLHTAGRLKPSQVIAPAIRIAREGIWVGPKFQQTAQVRLSCLQQDPDLAKTFLVNGQLAPIGTMVKQKELAHTLEELAREGSKSFYKGKIAKSIVETANARGGILTLEDLAKYQVRWREPLSGSYRGYRYLTAPPPSAGGLAILEILGVMEKAMPNGFAFRDVDALQVMAEAMRRGYVDRVKYLGDPKFVDVPVGRLSSPEYFAQLAQSIDVNHATPSMSLLKYAPSDGGIPNELSPAKHTTHISVVDKDGNAVAMTTTVNSYFGSCLMAKGTGVVLNDQMDDFTPRPGTPNSDGLVTGEGNAIAGGKTPLSSMSPTIVFQKEQPQKVMLVVGSNGGSTIPTTVAQIISNVIDAKMDIVRAIGLGRIHHQYLPDQLWVDRYGLEPATIKALEAKGHKIRRLDVWSGPQAVMVDEKTQLRSGASDPRLEGDVAGQD